METLPVQVNEILIIYLMVFIYLNFGIAVT